MRLGTPYRRLNLWVNCFLSLVTGQSTVNEKANILSTTGPDNNLGPRLTSAATLEVSPSSLCSTARMRQKGCFALYLQKESFAIGFLVGCKQHSTRLNPSAGSVDIMCRPRGPQVSFTQLSAALLLGYHAAVPQRGTRLPALHIFSLTLRLPVTAGKSTEPDGF